MRVLVVILKNYQVFSLFFKSIVNDLVNNVV